MSVYVSANDLHRNLEVYTFLSTGSVFIKLPFPLHALAQFTCSDKYSALILKASAVKNQPVNPTRVCLAEELPAG